MYRFAFALLALVFAAAPALAQETRITTVRGLGADQPYSLSFPEFLQQGAGGSESAVVLNHPDVTFQVDLRIAPAPPGESAEARVAAFSPEAVTDAERRIYADFTLERHALLRLPAGPALYYTAQMTSRAPGNERLRLVAVELFDGGRRYELRIYLAEDLFEDARPLIGFLLANLSPSAAVRPCCADPIDLP